jgi:hypothetical protein
LTLAERSPILSLSETVVSTESETAIGRYEADFIPTKPGAYTARVTGNVGGADVEVEAPLPEVADAGALSFPQPAATAQSGEGDKSMPVAGAILAIAALAVVALSRRHAGGRR